MRSASWPRTMAVALGSFLALGAILTHALGDQTPPAPAVFSAMNREIERRLDLAVNGSPPRAIKAPVSGTLPRASAPILPPSSGAAPAVTTLLGLLVLGGFVIAIGRGILVFARRRRDTGAGQAARYPAEERVEGTVAHSFWRPAS
jgi:hypothetical protein